MWHTTAAAKSRTAPTSAHDANDVTGAVSTRYRLRADNHSNAMGWCLMSVEKIALPSGEVLAKCALPILPSSLAVLKDGAEVVVGDLDGAMAQVEFATGKVLRRLLREEALAA